MEFKELISVFRQYRILFFSIVSISLLSGIFFYFIQPVQYNTSVLLHVTRSNVEEFSESVYTYDDFYRLTADELFSKTIYEWFSLPSFVIDIFKEASYSYEMFSERDIQNFFSAKNPSAQIVHVHFSVRTIEDGKSLAEAINTVINQKIALLNETQKKDSWFAIVTEDPVIILSHIPFTVSIIVSLLIGVFIGFWSVLFRYYLVSL